MTDSPLFYENQRPPDASAQSSCFWIMLFLLLGAATFSVRDRDAEGVNALQGIISATFNLLGLLWAAFLARTHLLRPNLRGVLPVALISAYLAITLASSAYSWSPVHSVSRALFYAAPLFAVYLLAREFNSSRVIAAFYWATLTFCLLGVVAGLIPPLGMPLLANEDWDFRLRLVFFHNSPIFVAYLSGVAFFLGLRLQNKLLWITQPFFLLVNLLTVTRWSTASILIVVSLLYFARLLRNNRVKTLHLFLFGVLGLSLIAGFVFRSTLWSLLGSAGTAQVENFTQASVEDGADLNGRVEVWTRVVNEIPMGVLLGYGFEGHRLRMREISPWADHAHNSVLESILASGYIGFSLLALAFLDIFWRLFAFADGPDRTCLLCALAYTGLASLMDPDVFTAVGAVVLGLALAQAKDCYTRPLIAPRRVELTA